MVILGGLVSERVVEAGLLHLQSARGLRPGEALRWRHEDLIIPSEAPEAGGCGIILLGMQKGTKANREQSVMVRDAVGIEVMALLKAITPPGSRVSDRLSLGGWGAFITESAAAMNLYDTGWSGHSPRAGFATYQYVLYGHLGIPEIMEVCRWMSKKTLKVYLDVVGAMASVQAAKLEKSHGDVAEFAAARAVPLLIVALRRKAQEVRGSGGQRIGRADSSASFPNPRLWLEK